MLGLESHGVYLACWCPASVSWQFPKYIQWYMHQVSGTVYEAVHELRNVVQLSEAANSMYINHGMGISFVNSVGTLIKNIVKRVQGQQHT